MLNLGSKICVEFHSNFVLKTDPPTDKAVPRCDSADTQKGMFLVLRYLLNFHMFYLPLEIRKFLHN